LGCAAKTSLPESARRLKPVGRKSSDDCWIAAVARDVGGMRTARPGTIARLEHSAFRYVRQRTTQNVIPAKAGSQYSAAIPVFTGSPLSQG